VGKYKIQKLTNRFSQVATQLRKLSRYLSWVQPLRHKEGIVRFDPMFWQIKLCVAKSQTEKVGP